MKKTLLAAILLVLHLLEGGIRAQEAGNVVYGHSRPRTASPAPGSLSAVEAKGSVLVAFLEANVLMNVPAEEYRACFAVVQEGATVAEGNAKITARIAEFITALKGLGVKTNDVFVDFIAQNRIYDVTGPENHLRETPSGFEVKQNVIVRYHDRALLEAMLPVAAKAGVFDVVKVDFVVTNVTALRQQLRTEAAKIIKQKQAAYAELFGVRVRPSAVDQERFNALFPAEMYGTYVASESSDLPRFGARVVGSRKPRTFHYSPLPPADFDAVLGPSSLEPVVQLTLSLRLKCAVPR